MRRAIAAGAFCLVSFAAPAVWAADCARPSAVALRDVHWQHQQPAHPLIGQVFKGEQPIVVASDTCTRSPLQQLIVEVWDIIRGGGIVLLGEVHDNPEHHAVRGDILWPRLDQVVPTHGLRPAAVFEHIRTSQQAGLDSFYRHVPQPPAVAGTGSAARTRVGEYRLAGGRDLLSAFRCRPAGEAADLSRQCRPRTHAVAGSRPGPAD